VIGRRRSNVSFTKSGRTKSSAFSCVSRTRSRRAGERRKRRGRCTNFLTGEAYPFDGSVASLTGRSVPCSACLAVRYDSLDPYPFDRLLASRHQQFLYKVCFWIRHPHFESSSDRHKRTFKPCICSILETAKRTKSSHFFGRTRKKPGNFEVRSKSERALVGFDAQIRCGN
jgi:hypothetical protein